MSKLRVEALVRLERPGGGFIEPGTRCELDEESVRVLIDLGLVRLIGPPVRTEAMLHPAAEPSTAAMR